MTKAKHPLRQRAPTKPKMLKPKPAMAVPASTGLLSMLEGLGDDKSDAMHAIHMRLVEMRAFIDDAIANAEGDLKSVLTSLRGFLF
jgi:hypothetical protein